MKTSAAFTLVLLFATSLALSAKKTHSYRSETQTPEEQLAGFTVPEGFVVELVASERDGIINPIDLAFDDAGRLWTQTASMYPLDPFAEQSFGEIRKLMEDPDIMMKNPEFERIRSLYEGRSKGDDKILIIDNPWAQNPTQPIVWADGLAIPQSILPYKNGAYVAHGSELIFLEDTNGDGIADQRSTLLKGFGYIDTHTMAHLLIRAPGDWIHFSHGALNKGLVESTVSGNTAAVSYSKIVRMSTDGARLNVVSAGLNNIWGFQLRANGQWYGTEANDLSWSVVPMEPGTGLKGIGDDRIRPYQPWIPPLHDFRVGGTGISGLEFSEDGSSGFPSEWDDVALLANPITSTINAVRIVRNADGTVTAEHLPDLLQSRDDWFRPVNLEFGPDGCLYIADWYNKIISHNELPRNHPERDKAHGRIWRIRHESQQPKKIPNLYQAETSHLVTHLSAPTLWEKRAAWHQIGERQAIELVPELTQLAADKTAAPITRIHALWSLESLHYFDEELMVALTHASDPDLRREAYRSLVSFDLAPGQMANFLRDVIKDPHVMVRSEALRTLSEYGQANREIIDILISFCRPDILGNDLGGPYERKFERYLARLTLEQHEAALVDFLDSTQADQYPADHLFWAIQDLSAENHETYFLKLYSAIAKQVWDTSTFISVADGLANPAIKEVVSPYFAESGHARNLVARAIEVLGRVDTQLIASVLPHAVQTLLDSADSEDQANGLRDVVSYRIPGFEDATIRLLEAAGSPPVIRTLAVAALQNAGTKNAVAALRNAFANTDLNFNARLAAFDQLVKSGRRIDSAKLHRFFKSLDDSQRDEFIKQCSRSELGSAVLFNLIKFNLLAVDQIATSELSRIVGWADNPQHFRTIIQERKANEIAAFQETFQSFMAIAESGTGDPSLGQPLFHALCLSCHSAGSQGVGWAPSLDGSAHRENEALLTAMLDPDAAVEGAYRLNRVLKTDGSVVEGFLEKNDSRGVTLRFMGGASLFIPAHEIEGNPRPLPQSAMPKGLINQIPSDQVANLLAYIRTLE